MLSEQDPSRNAPVFVVGVPRSGTTLLAAMLTSHSRIHCGPETHVLRGLFEPSGVSLVLHPSLPRAVAYLAARAEYRSRVLEDHDLTENDVRSYLSGHGVSLASLFGALTEPLRARAEKPRWAEKTPSHLRYAPLLRAAFPSSPIVRILRDPRDVAESLTRMPWWRRDFGAALLHSELYDQAWQSFARGDDLAFTIRFEALLAEPERELRHLCDRIGEEYEAGMLSFAGQSDRVIAEHEPWKADVRNGLDPGRGEAWRRWPESKQREALAWAEPTIRRLGYPTGGESVSAARANRASRLTRLAVARARDVAWGHVVRRQLVDRPARSS
jgi:hypothetical protein